jgi:hypothetical protein
MPKWVVEILEVSEAVIIVEADTIDDAKDLALQQAEDNGVWFNEPRREVGMAWGPKVEE